MVIYLIILSENMILQNTITNFQYYLIKKEYVIHKKLLLGLINIFF